MNGDGDDTEEPGTDVAVDGERVFVYNITDDALSIIHI